MENTKILYDETAVDASVAEPVAEETVKSGPTRSELRKRNRAIRTSKVLFRAIDVLFSPSQNSCPYVTKVNLPTIKRTLDVVYDETDPKICQLDVYRVDSEELQPAVMIIHGGGFSAGDKKYRKGLAEYFALNGFTAFCVNYGLAPDYIFPAPIKHLVSAANFVYDNAARFGADGDRIFVCGDSAGGYYASMLAAFNSDASLGRVFGAELKFDFLGALLNCGLYDLETVFQTKYLLDIDDTVLISFTGIGRKDFGRYKYKDVCMPSKFITDKYPPTFVIYSPRDMFCKGQGVAMIDRLNEAGVYCESYAARHNSSNHCFSLTWRGEDAVAANELMMSFAKRLASRRIKL